MVAVDSDGDLLLRRRDSEVEDAVLSEMHIEAKWDQKLPCGMHEIVFNIRNYPSIRICHCLETSISDVGFQVWRGAIVLTDYMLHNTEFFKNRTILELGVGSGLPSIAISRLARCVYATDVGDILLAHCAANVAANVRAAQTAAGIVAIKRIDWFHSLESTLHPNVSPVLDSSPSFTHTNDQFSWTSAEVLELTTHLDYVIAADTVYDNTATEAFMRTALKLLLSCRQKSPDCRFVVALERRMCFTLQEMGCSSPAYDFWRTLFLPNSRSQEDEKTLLHATARKEEEDLLMIENGSVFVGQRVDLAAMPQFVQGYERSEYLEVWELRVFPLNKVIERKK